MKRSPSQRLLLASQNTLLALSAALLLLKAYTTLNWRMEHDTPLLHYAAFLMDRHNVVPYRDLFETSMPGTFAFHYAIGRLFGYGDLAFRYVDLTLLVALLVATYAFMARFGRLVAFWAAILFGLVYLSYGQTMSLQRDYIGTIPVATALLCLPVQAGRPVRLLRFTILGLLSGVSLLIKPHLGIAFPVILGALLAFRWQSRAPSTLDFLKCAAVAGASLLVPAAIALLWLASHSALLPFREMVFHYLPLHNSMTGRHETLSGLAFVVYLVGRIITFGGFGALLCCSLLAYYHVFTANDGDKATAIALKCLALCTFAYALYPALAGRFWSYHYMPFAYFCCISAGLSFFQWPQRIRGPSSSRRKAFLLSVIFVMAAAVQLPLHKYLQSLASDFRSGPRSHAPKNGRVDEIAAWLKEALHPGDTVQPLDWTGGSIHGMLLAEARLATQFMYDYHFYHHVSSRYIQSLRHSFMIQLQDASPRFVIEVLVDKPWVSGKDTTREFPELRQFLSDHYALAYEGDGYRIYGRMKEAPF